LTCEYAGASHFHLHPLETKQRTDSSREMLNFVWKVNCTACELRQPPAMTTVQIAIQDRSYASALRDLLVADGMHHVYIVDNPSPAMDGVIVADESTVRRLPKPAGIEPRRYVAFIERPDFDANRLFEAGVRYVIHRDTPPEVGRLTVFAAEGSADHECIGGLESAFDEEYQLFLQALRIDGR